MTDPERVKIEEQIISVCLQGFFIAAVEILQPNNFKVPIHSQIFSIIQTQHLTDPIDILTVSIRYRKEYGPVGIHRITELCDASVVRDIGPYCLMLLEIDMREKFAELIQGYEDSSISEEDFESAAIWKQCREHIISPSYEVFTAIEHIQKYIKHVRPDEVTEYEQMMTAIPKMIHRIKSQTQVKLLIDNLKRHCNTYGHHRETLLNITTDILVALLIRSTIPANLEEKLRQINREGI